MEDNLTHTSLGKYHLIASLGGGGMAKVYLALMAGPGGFNKLLVVKVLREDVLSGSHESVQMFWDEARLAARLVHPNIVQTYEGGSLQGRYFLAMEYLDGQAYRAVQNRLGPRGLPVHEEIRIIAETARGLHYSHELRGFEGEPLGVVHRDVSPQNVFLTYDGQVKLLDFGIAKTTDSNHKTQVGVIKGKLDYIAPEQLRGDPLDRRADIFALGVMLWEAVAGQRFAGGRKVSEVTKVHSRVTGGEPRIQDVAPDAPAGLVAIIERALALDPDERWPDAATLADALENYSESMGYKASTKSLSDIMTRLFEHERQSMHKLIEHQVNSRRHSVEIGETTSSLPRVGAQDTRSGSSVWPGRPGSERTQPRHTAADSVWASYDASRGQRRSSKVRTVVMVGLVALLAGGITLALRAHKDEPSAVLPPAAAVAAPSLAAREVPPASSPTAVAPVVTQQEPRSGERPKDDGAGAMMLEVAVSPPGATVLLDGTPISAPFSGRFPRDGVLHRLDASAEGHRPSKRFLSFDRDHSIQIVLERVAPAAGSSRRRHDAPDEPRSSSEPDRPRAQPAPGHELEPPRRERPPGEIDTDDPYATMKRSIQAPQ